MKIASLFTKRQRSNNIRLFNIGKHVDYFFITPAISVFRPPPNYVIYFMEIFNYNLINNHKNEYVSSGKSTLYITFIKYV